MGVDVDGVFLKTLVGFMLVLIAGSFFVGGCLFGHGYCLLLSLCYH